MVFTIFKHFQVYGRQKININLRNNNFIYLYMISFDEFLTKEADNLKRLNVFRQELETQRKVKMIFAAAIAVILTALGILLIIETSLIMPSVSIILLGFVVSAVWYRFYTAKYHSAIKHGIVTRLVKSVFEFSDYKPDEFISEFDFKESGFISKISSYSGSDLIKANGDVNYRASNLQIFSKQNNIINFIDGFLIEIIINFNFKNRILILPQSKTIKIKGYEFILKPAAENEKPIEINLPQTKKEFKVYSSADNNSVTISEDLIYYLSDLSENLKSDIALSLKNKKAYIMISGPTAGYFKSELSRQLSRADIYSYYKDMILLNEIAERLKMIIEKYYK